MKASKEYIIQFAGLNAGEHLFELSIENKFFEDLDYSEIKQGKLLVKLKMIKQSTMMVLHFDIKGTVKVDCDRCAENFDLPIHGKSKLVVKVGGNMDQNEDDDIIGISENEYKIDLTHYLYEYIILSIPIKRVHPEISSCDESALKKLDGLVINSEKEEKQDPRWDQLKNIKLN